MRKLSKIFSILIIISLFVPLFNTTQADEVPSINVKIPKNEIDLVFTVGRADYDLSNLNRKIDTILRPKLSSYNINANITAIETSEISTNDSDASTIFNSWKQFPEGNSVWQLKDNALYTPQNPAFETGFYDPSTRDSKNFTIESRVNINQPNQPLGFVFKLHPNNEYTDTERWNMYYFWQSYDSEAQETVFAIFKVYGHTLGWHGDGRTVGRSSTYSGTPLRAYNGHLFGWPDHLPYDYGGFPHGTPQQIGLTVTNTADSKLKTTILDIGKVRTGSYAETRGWHDFKLVVERDKIVGYFDNQKVIDVIDPDMYEKGYYGVFQYSHVSPYFQNLKASNVNVKDFREVLQQPEWRQNTKRFVTNITKDFFEDNEMKSASQKGIVASLLSSEEINFSAIGDEPTRNEFTRYLSNNSLSGKYFKSNSSADLDRALSDYADYIIQEVLKDSEVGTSTFTVGDRIEYEFENLGGVAGSDFGGRPWLLNHDQNYYENSIGIANFSGDRLSELPSVFDYPGRYEIYYKEVNTIPRYFNVHRKPVPVITAEVNQRADGYYVTTTSRSYDTDHFSETAKGIVSEEWRWKSVNDTSWKTGKLSGKINTNENYLVQLRVKDKEGAWSHWESQLVTTENIAIPPVSRFTISNNTIWEGTNAVFNNMSYAPGIASLTKSEWEIEDETGAIVKRFINNSDEVHFNFRNSGLALPSGVDYRNFKINLVVTDSTGLKSRVYVQKITVTADIEPPVLKVNLVENSDWTKNNVKISVEAYDTQSGLKNVRLPNGQTNSNSRFEYEVSSNGTYTFIAEDVDGNVSRVPITINHIDKEGPIGSHTRSIQSEVEKEDILYVTATDAKSGVKRIKLPDGTYANSASASYKITKNGKYTFVLEDKVGNTTNYIIDVENIFYKPNLTVTPFSDRDYVNLKWSMNDDWQEYRYMIYKKEMGYNEFQSIPAKSNVKVLNIYPRTNNTVSFTNWKGESHTIPISASVKMWMEKANSESAKGYGKGLIDVDIVSIPEFNSNPNKYLKNADGSWKYDVVFEGALDGNGFRLEDDYSPSAVMAISEFIEDGQGYLAGHDTIMYPAVWNSNTNGLRNYLNIKVRDLDPVANGVGQGGVSSGNTQVRITSKGFLTNHPWSIGDVGNILTVPASHTTGQVAYGNIWMEYESGTGRLTDINGNGNANYYLTTWNNTAQIQTGHSNGAATPDEQKVLANTLFYLAQKTTETSWDDHTSQDVNAPNKPVIKNVELNGETGKLNIEYSHVEDNGTYYDYYVEATGQNNGIKSTSDIKSAILLSGLDGYSIVIDTNPNTVPDRQIETKANVASLDFNLKTSFYVHVAAVDKVGNISEVAHYHYKDITPPEIDIKKSTEVWTKDDVKLTVKATDDLSGVKRIKLPDGTFVNASEAVFNVSENGSYLFEAEDFTGNKSSKSITVSNIDKEKPTNPSISLDSNWTNRSSVPVSITGGTDSKSGVGRTEYKLVGAENTDWKTYVGSFSVSNEGITTVYARTIDKVGNISNEANKQVRIDRTKPVLDSVKMTDNGVDIKASDALSGLDSLPYFMDWKLIGKDSQFKSVNRNWSTNFDLGKLRSNSRYDYIIKVRDKAGNETVSTVNTHVTPVDVEFIGIKDGDFKNTITIDLKEEILPFGDVIVNVKRSGSTVALLESGKTFKDENLDYERDYEYDLIVSTNVNGNIIESSTVTVTQKIGSPSIEFNLNDTTFYRTVFSREFNVDGFMRFRQGGDIKVSLLNSGTSKVFDIPPYVTYNWIIKDSMNENRREEVIRAEVVNRENLHQVDFDIVIETRDVTIKDFKDINSLDFDIYNR